jgi:hypothetical protein
MQAIAGAPHSFAVFCPLWVLDISAALAGSKKAGNSL